ncbi:MAG TPA: DUF4134 family protein [Mucilaginibacter sp.]|jgi:uncharacterized membrane protein YidH (DUF202 family)
MLLQVPGITEMQQARNQLSSSFFSALDCALVLAFILAMGGAIRIYHNWQMGEREITMEIAAWFFAALFMVLAGVFLRAVFSI